MKTLAPNILIKAKAFDEESESGIIYHKDNEQKMKETCGTVVATYDDCERLKKDDFVYYDAHYFDEITIDGEEYHVIPEQHIFVIA